MRSFKQNKGEFPGCAVVRIPHFTAKCQDSITDWGTINKILEVIYATTKKERKTNKQTKTRIKVNSLFQSEATNRAVCFRHEAIYKLNYCNGTRGKYENVNF